MPAVVSHYLLAERIYNSMHIYAPQTSINHTAFLWGSFGPDIFLVHRAMPWQKGRSLSYISTKMHDYPAEKLLNYISIYAKNNSDKIALSYLFGFITHYALDSIAHPYVLFQSEKLSKCRNGIHSSICHNEIESVLDTLFLKKESGIKISSFKMQKTAPYDRYIAEDIAEILHGFFLSNGFGNIPESEIIQAQNDWRRSLIMLNDKHKLKKRAVRIGEKALKLSPMLSPLLRDPHPDLSFDYANMKHEQWFDSEINPRTENFFELADKAEQKSVDLIMTILSDKYLLHEECMDSFSGHPKK